MLNLSESKQESFNKLVNQYKNDLFTKAYIEALVKRSVDTVVKAQETEEYYNNNKDAFKLNEDLVKFRYIHVDKNIIDLDKIEDQFKRFNAEDKNVLDSISIQFKSYSLKDSIWIRVNQVIDKIPAITTENKNELLKKSNFVQLKDSLGVYYAKNKEKILAWNKTYVLKNKERIKIMQKKWMV